MITKRTIPKEGKINTIYKRLSEYILPVDKEWINRVKSTDYDSIKKLRRFLGMEDAKLDFPESYIQFMKYMGENDGGLLSNVLLGSGSISQLLDLNEEIYLYERDTLEPYWFEFFLNEMGVDYAISLKDINNQFIGISDEEKVSSNFEKFLFQCAVKQYEKKYFSINKSFGINAITSDKILKLESNQDIFENLSQKYKLKKSWFSDEWNYFLYSDEMSIYIEKRIGVLIRLYSNDNELLYKIYNELLYEFELNINNK